MNERLTGLFLAIFLLHGFSLFATDPANDPSVERKLSAKKITSKITIDGLLDETEWADAQPSQPFWEQFPYDTSFSDAQSEVRVLFDDQYIYFGIKCSDPEQGEYVISSLRRDFRGRGNDGITVWLDPFKNQNNSTFLVPTLMEYSVKG